MILARRFGIGIKVVALLALAGNVAADDVLPSWNEGASQRAIVEFVAQVTDRDGPNYVSPTERIAVFDNDGTLWAEQPLYFQLVFALDRIRALAPEHPEWKTTEPFKSALDNDLEGILAGGKHALMEVIMATHAGMTARQFSAIVRDWLASARHSTSGQPYTEMVYQPMLELLAYLRANEFKTYITSGGGIEFIRVFAEEVYGIPPEQVIGSSIKTRYEYRDGDPALIRLPELNFFDDKDGKPVAINQHIGRRPIAAFGNSDGDLPMLQWTCSGNRTALCLYVHHTDAKREWAYDRESHIGRLNQGLDQARTEGWTVVNMQNDWNVIFSFEVNSNDSK